MNKLILILAIGFLFTNCKEEKRTDYVINGKAEGVYNGIRVYLNRFDEKGQQTPIDTAIVMNGKFKFNGSVTNPSMHSITVNSITSNKTFMLENSEITIDINKDDILKSVVTGSNSNDDLEKYQNEVNTMNEKAQNLMTQYSKANQEGNAFKKDSLMNEIKEQRKQLESYAMSFVKEHPDSYLSLDLLNYELRKKNTDITGLSEAFNNLKNNVKNTPEAKILNSKIQQLIIEKEKLAHLEIGKVAPNFEAPNPDGKTVSLNDVKGKVTIIDFWAAWCGPCRRENPNVVKVYEKYHNKGLEIIGVSLDGDRRQQNPKQAWLDAIEKDNLTWYHVSSLNYFNDPVAKLYNIQSIPATFILDEEGKIVAKNLRGKALEDKVKELIEKS